MATARKRNTILTSQAVLCQCAQEHISEKLLSRRHVTHCLPVNLSLLLLPRAPQPQVPHHSSGHCLVHLLLLILCLISNPAFISASGASLSPLRLVHFSIHDPHTHIPDFHPRCESVVSPLASDSPLTPTRIAAGDTDS